MGSKVSAGCVHGPTGNSTVEHICPPGKTSKHEDAVPATSFVASAKGGQQGSAACRGPSAEGQQLLMQTLFDQETATGEEGRETLRQVFHWLSWAPPPQSPCCQALYKHFPEALPGQVVHARTRAVLESAPYLLSPPNTLFGTSICPDEVNNERGDIGEVMKRYWGECFPLGGICGAPFVGKTGFGAFSAHVPDGGNILMLYGPHVGITAEGEVGKYLRTGQCKASTACGAIIGAYNALLAGDQADADASRDDLDLHDMQMAYIKKKMRPEMDSLKTKEDPMASLAHVSYKMVADKVDDIINTNFGSGYLVLIGGIMINMPYPYDDHFLPLRFEMLRQGEKKIDLMAAFKVR